MEFKQGGSGSKDQALTLILHRPGSLRILGTAVSSPSKEDLYTSTTMCKTASQWEPAVEHGEPSSTLCDDLEGWDGAGRED